MLEEEDRRVHVFGASESLELHKGGLIQLSHWLLPALMPGWDPLVIHRRLEQDFCTVSLWPGFYI